MKKLVLSGVGLVLAAAMTIVGVGVANAAQPADTISITGIYYVTDTASCAAAFTAVGGPNVATNITDNCTVNDQTGPNSAVNAYPWIVVAMDRGDMTNGGAFTTTDVTVTVGGQTFTATVPAAANPNGWFTMSLGQLNGATNGTVLADPNQSFAPGTTFTLSVGSGVTLIGQTSFTTPKDITNVIPPKTGVY
jgi:hypothetical protein